MKKLTFILILSLSTSAFAQTAIEGRHENAFEKYDIANHNPVACDDETHAAAKSWRDAGVTFAPSFSAFVDGQVQRNSDEPNTQISFEGSSTFYTPSASAEVYRIWTNRYFAYNGASYWIFSDADVIVNADQYQYALNYNDTYFDCGDAATTSRMQDFHTIMAHELGHTGGLGHHSTSFACTMSYPTYNGPFKGFCSDSTTKMRGIYAAPAY